MSERYLSGAWRFMRLKPVPCALCLALALAASASAGSSRSTLDRSALDRPDDVNGPQIHAVYVLPSDGTDASSDTNGGIAQDIFSWTDWLETQTGGRALRIDTYQGQPDVSFVRIPETAEDAKANGGYALWTTIVNEIRAASFVDPEKRYAVYYGGPGTIDIGGAGGPFAGSGYAVLFGINPRPARPRPGFSNAGVLHEVLHSLGFVPACAPHYVGGHVNDDPHDIMYFVGAGSVPRVLDAGHDDYYGAHIPGCPDLSDSPFLTVLPHYLVSVTIKGHGSAGLTPGDLTCTRESPCKASVHPSETVYLGASADADSHFVRWSGACSGTQDACQVTITGDASATAEFALNPRLLLKIRGAGAIRITDTGSAETATCRRDCSPRYATHTRLVLRARPRTGSRFAGWHGKCSGAHGCTVKLAAADATVTATFVARKPPRCAKGKKPTRTHPCRR